jgi:hypothetical protein
LLPGGPAFGKTPFNLKAAIRMAEILRVTRDGEPVLHFSTLSLSPLTSVIA